MAIIKVLNFSGTKCNQNNVIQKLFMKISVGCVRRGGGMGVGGGGGGWLWGWEVAFLLSTCHLFILFVLNRN